MTKLVGGLLMPVTVILALLLLGLLLQLFRRRRSGFLFLLLGTASLAALSLPIVAERLVQPLESQYAPLIDPPPADWIVVLGGGGYSAMDRPATSRLTESSLARLIEGLRLARLQPNAQVIFSGWDSAELMAAAAQELGFSPQRPVVLLTETEDTAAEARAAAQRIGAGQTVILVTSAFHMRRAVAQFEGQGIAVIPAPAGYLIDSGPGEPTISDQLPRAVPLRWVERFWWETLGLWWARLSGEL